MRILPAIVVLAALFPFPNGAAAQNAPLCDVATDPEFGLTALKPIPVGGGATFASARQRRYLGVLRGPAGEVVDPGTTRSSSPQPELKAIVDVYQITHAGRQGPVALYFNAYAFGTPQVPQGFTCSEPLTAALGPPPLEPASVGAEVAWLAIEQGASRTFEPIPLTEGATTRAVVFDMFRLVAARVRLQAPGINPGGFPPASVIVAYPATCNGAIVPASAIDLVGPQGQALPRVPGLQSGPALSGPLSGTPVPPGAVGAMFPMPFPPPDGRVRLTYPDSPDCPGDVPREVLLPLRGEASRLLASESPAMPAGVTLVDPAVFLQVLIDVDGGFTRPVVVGGPDVLTAAAVEAIGTWKAAPARIAGQPVVSAVTLRVAFTPVAH
jgi:hypothetical protein